MKLLPTSEGSVGNSTLFRTFFMPIDVSVQVDKNHIYIYIYIRQGCTQVSTVQYIYQRPRNITFYQKTVGYRY
jgi:hypothetical protein